MFVLRRTGAIFWVRCKLLLIALTTSFWLSACSLLSDPSGSLYDRAYLGGGALASDETDSVGGSALLGFDASSRFSIEANHAVLGEADLAPTGTISDEVSSLSALTYLWNSGNGLSTRRGLSALGRVGVGVLENVDEAVPINQLDDVHALAGLGIEYGARNGLAIRLEGVSHDLAVNYAQLGFVYRFGRSAHNQSQPAATSAQVTTTAQSNDTPLEAARTVGVDVKTVRDGIALDSDRDGVSDVDDKCADTVPAIPVGEDGCEFFNGVFKDVAFIENTNRLTRTARIVLGRVINVLKRYPRSRITIAVHTNSAGSRNDNLILSKQRAIAVTKFLVERGIAGTRLRPQAFGESKPLVSGATETSRHTNERVEFALVPLADR